MWSGAPEFAFVTFPAGQSCPVGSTALIRGCPPEAPHQHFSRPQASAHSSPPLLSVPSWNCSSQAEAFWGEASSVFICKSLSVLFSFSPSEPFSFTQVLCLTSSHCVLAHLRLGSSLAPCGGLAFPCLQTGWSKPLPSEQYPGALPCWLFQTFFGRKVMA